MNAALEICSAEVSMEQIKIIDIDDDNKFDNNFEDDDVYTLKRLVFSANNEMKKYNNFIHNLFH